MKISCFRKPWSPGWWWRGWETKTSTAPSSNYRRGNTLLCGTVGKSWHYLVLEDTLTTGKTIALTRQTFVDKVMSLLFNMLSRLVITFLPTSKYILCLQSPSTVILEPQKIKYITISTVSPSICHEVMGTDAMIFVFWMLSFKPTFSLSSFHFQQEAF